MLLKQTKKELSLLTTEATCKIYSLYLKRALQEKHVISRLINTKDYGFPYEHHFNVVMEGEDSFYVVDLTYEQFHSLEFDLLLQEGYQKMDNEEFQTYLEIVGQEKKDIFFQSLFGLSKKRK